MTLLSKALRNKSRLKFHSLFKMNFKTLFRVRYLKHYKPHLRILVDLKGYIIKTADTERELKSVFSLRHEVFYQELLNQRNFMDMDMDSFDLSFDHLIIIHKQTQRIIGTYRLNSTLFNKKFYSSTEFNIKNILRLNGNKLELGRACIHRDFRNSLVLSILWKGLWEYIQKTETVYLFGCSSVMTTDFQKALGLYTYLMEKHDGGEIIRVNPLARFSFKNMHKALENLKNESDILYEIGEKEKMIPSLFRFYLKQGAKVCGEPALDKQLKCIDFFTLLDISALKKATEHRLNQ